MRAEVVVVGAGVVGCSLAFELAGAGYDVLVVDKAAAPGHGSTSASSAIVRFNYSTWEGVAASWEAWHGWNAWTEFVEACQGEQLARFHRTGLAMLDAPRVPRNRYLALFDRAGITYEEWDADALVQHVPGVDPGRFGPPARLDDDRFWADATGRLGAVYTPDAGYVDDPTLATRNLADAAARRGARFEFNATVARVSRRGGRVSGVRLVDGRWIECEIIVNAAGPWSAALNRLADVTGDFTVSTRPLRQEVHQLPAGPGSMTTVADLDLGTYSRPTPGGGLLVGGTEPECDELEWLDSPDDCDVHPTNAIFDAQVTRVARRFPQLAIPNRPRGTAGVYDVTDDWTPVYDRTMLPGFYVAIGTSGNQFKNAPVIGRMMTKLIDHVENGADHDTDPVRFSGEHVEFSLGAFSRSRPVNADSTGTVMG